MASKIVFHLWFVASALVAALNSSIAKAQIPYPISTAHPRLFATEKHLTNLKARISPALPEQAGTIRIRFAPQTKGRNDADDSILFALGTDPNNLSMTIQYMDSGDSGSTVKLRAKYVQGAEIVVKDVSVSTAVASEIILRYSENLQGLSDISVTLDGTPWLSQLGRNWKATGKRMFFVGRKDQKVAEFSIVGTGFTWDGSSADWNGAAAGYYFLKTGKAQIDEINACLKVAMPTDENHLCNAATGGRHKITDAAKRMGLGYKLTGNADYFKAAEAYAKHIMSVADLAAGTEWSMNARIAALGIIYDWFYNELEESMRQQMRDVIKRTIRTDIPLSMKDLIAAVCNEDGPMQEDLKCKGNADLSRFYISGHQAAAMTGVAMALIAIHDRSTEVRPMLDLIYGHLTKGVLPARDYISADGGHQTMFAYNIGAGELVERLIMWRRAFVYPDDDPRRLVNDIRYWNTGFAINSINPYIYALRGGGTGALGKVDGTFPARSDNFDTRVTDEFIGYMALAAAIERNPVAASFYEDQIQRRRKRYSPEALWDALYFPTYVPGAKGLQSYSSLPLAEKFHVSGNVFMRDTWDYDRATLLEFKSSTFSSENHHHLDQNSFSLFYKQPLLIDSGAYDQYNSSHWYNYYRRTIAHNSIVVFDKNSVFQHEPEGLDSNDGGQWYVGELYPTLDEIKPGGKNSLQGIARFENKTDYAYAQANAAKAYPALPGETVSRLHAQQGFTRNILYLRNTKSGKPVIAVFDRVVTSGRLPATSLLHSVTRPETEDPQVGQGSDALAGRYTVNSVENKPLRIRNGTAMVTVEPLLPVRATIKVVGGAPGGESRCDKQLPEAPSSANTDCRFTVRMKGRDGNWAWTNVAPLEGSSAQQMPEVGSWRIEISPVPEHALAPADEQFFLNVLRVGDDQSPTLLTSSSRLLGSSDGSAAAVELDDGNTIVFAKTFAPSTVLRWTPGNRQSSLLIAGLLPDLLYKVTLLASGEYELKLVAEGTANAHRASAKGVLQIAKVL